MNESKKYYGAIDGLRSYSAIGIILMHVLDNGEYNLNGFVFEKLIPSFTKLVFLFMIISSFSMCCGYYEKVINNRITVEEFYSKRYKKILPFFAVLCLIDIVVSPSYEALYETFANLTLCFGLLPNAGIGVIGVGWFLGLVFVFYLLFPFFCYLICDKRRAWFSFIVALIFNVLCSQYFFNENHVITGFSNRTNIIYCAVFFLAGGLIYLYKEKLSGLSEKFRWVVLVILAVLIVAYYVIGSNVIIMLAMFSLMLIYAVQNDRSGLLKNSVTGFLSNISMEIYLSHMVIYRMLEKIGMVHYFDSQILSYVLAAIGTVVGAVVFSVIIKKIIGFIERIKNE
jgi:peptidoglycan/LPS O-acetylase OafA/YrhL